VSASAIGPAITSLLAAMLSFQVGASIAKGLITAVGAPGTTALRLGLSALMLCIMQRPWRDPPSRTHIRVILVYGVALGTMNFVFFTALSRIPLGIAVGLEFTGPLAVALFASRRRLDLLWLALAVIGVVCLLPIAPSASHLDAVGVAFALAAGACWALYIIYGQKAGRAHGPNASTWGLIVAAVLIAPIGVFDAGTALISKSVLPGGLAVAVLSSALPYTLEMRALRRLSAKSYGTLMSLEPALAALIGFLLLSERLSLLQWAGIVSVMVASLGTLGHEPTPAAGFTHE
jgi:inner membrane transporter RhtA